MDSATSISCTTWKVSQFDTAYCLIMAIFQCARAVLAMFRPHYCFWFKIWHNWIQHTRLPIKKDAVISGTRHHFRRLLWWQCLHMHSKYINSTSSREYVTKMDSATSISYMTSKFLAVRRCFSPILAIFHGACSVMTILLLPV